VVEHLRRTSETVILLLVVLSPWVFGCIHPFFLYCLTAGICLLLLFWAIELLIAPKRSVLSRFQIPLLALVAIVCLQILPHQILADTISPVASKWKSQLMPDQLEVLSDGQVAKTPSMSARNRISINPPETLRKLYWLVLMVLVFTRVQDLATVDSLRRLCYVCLINGSILAYFSIIQHFTEDETGKLFWTFQSMGAAFGTFINRNHFAFYINICFGLSLGLVGSRQSQRLSGFDMDSLIEGLKDSLSLWMISVLVFMLGAVILCSSRGGMISLGGSLLITAAFTASTGTFKKGWWWFVLAAGIFGLAAWVQVWLGFDFDTSRYAYHTDNRTAMWMPLLRLVQEFPILGTGLGTLPFAEPWTRSSAASNSFLQHAHNEYLQVAIETGLLGLGCVVTFLLLMVTKIAKRVRESRHNSWLYVGLLFSLASICLHSFTEFGLAIPAIAFLSAVVMGHIAGLGRVKPETPPSTIVGQSLLRVVAIGMIAFVFFAFQQAKRFDLAERHLLAAQRVEKEGGSPELELENYRQAISHTPHNVEFLMEVAQLNLERLASIDRLADPQFAKKIGLKETQRSQIETLIGKRDEAHSNEADAEKKKQNWELAETRIRDVLSADQISSFDSIRKAEVIEAQDLLLTWRELSPMSGLSHFLIGRHQEKFEKANAPLDYFLRARMSRPMDATLAVLTGSAYQDQKNLEEAIKYYRESLTLSPIELSEVLRKCVVHAGMEPEQIVDRVLPEGDLAIAVNAASWFANRQKATGTDYSDIVMLLRERALETKEMQRPNSFLLYRQKANLCSQLQDKQGAIDALEASIRYVRDNSSAVRIQLVRLLMEQDTKEAHQQAEGHLRRVLRRKDAYFDTAEKLFKELVRKKQELDLRRD